MDTSSYAYDHVLRNLRPSRPSGGAMEDMQSPASTRAFLSPLFWLYRLIIRLTVGETISQVQADVKSDAGFIENFSRVNRRFIKAGKLGTLDTRKILMGLYVEKLLFGGLTPSQKQEKIARIAYGRVRVYGLRYWGTRLQRQAQLSCFDHGWWRMPQRSRTARGLWDAQLPDN